MKKMAGGRSPAGLKYKPLKVVLRMQVTPEAFCVEQAKGHLVKTVLQRCY